VLEVLEVQVLESFYIEQKSSKFKTKYYPPGQFFCSRSQVKPPDIHNLDKMLP
jgi:hypothetical protein